jgi:ribosomal protein L37AE/L43A
MRLRERSQESSARVPVVPDCANCHQRDHVREMKLHDLAPGIQYWRCDECGFVWATQNGDELRAASTW